MLAFTAVSAHAQWPQRAVKIIVPFAAGGYPDVVTRIAAEAMSTQTGSPFIVENRPGASGNIGMEAVAKAAPDGYTFGMVIPSHLTTNQFLFRKLPYRADRDLVVITKLSTTGSVLIVNPRLPVDTVQDFVNLLRREPGKHNYASVGIGSFQHIVAEAIASQSGTRMVPIHYSGAGEIIGALKRGDVSMALLPAATSIPLVRSGQLKALAITTGERLPFAPEVATLRESGIPIVADSWIGLVAPARTPASVLEAMRAGLSQAFNTPAVHAQLKTLFAVPYINESPAAFLREVEEESARWKPIVDSLNIKLD